MTFEERLKDILARMRDAKLDAIVALHDGAHFIETPNPVTVLTGFKSLGPAAAILRGDGRMTLIVAPAWDAERATEQCPQARVVGADDIVEALTAALSNGARKNAGLAGMRYLPSSIASRVAAALPAAPSADTLVFDAARTKTDDEIGHAREATRIAELGYRRLLDIARPSMSEDELAAELKWFMKTLGADDNFLLLCASPHNRAVQPSTGRRFQKGDIILAEITPSVRGQLAQICRTVVVGDASAELAEKYALVVHAMDQGIAAARPGVPMAEVCRAINTVLEAKGYGEFCHPPHIRRRGHGLGFASMRPGDVALDNETILEPDMIFMIHPNQYLPETGYLLCGEPVLLTANGAEPLTAQKAALATVAG
ncbi:MAG TPA: Xaa-Pro peptidase family protein [Xanthobacteraceae bacterium]|nr:Xaa-Pro peptidase family protein [Xanthobacteraceae bacterium]